MHSLGFRLVIELFIFQKLQITAEKNNIYGKMYMHYVYKIIILWNLLKKNEDKVFSMMELRKKSISKKKMYSTFAFILMF